MNQSESGKKIITTANLQGYFFEGLLEINRNSICPLPESIIYYSSNVLDKFALSEHLFEIQEGKVRDKILGTKLLEATQLNRDDQMRVYKEVADTSLIVCGYFSESVNRKIVDTSYYAQLGMMAYEHLNNVLPAFLDIPCFYHMVATSFGHVTNLMTILASKERAGSQNELLFKKMMNGESISDKDMLIGGVTLPISKKVS